MYHIIDILEQIKIIPWNGEQKKLFYSGGLSDPYSPVTASLSR